MPAQTQAVGHGDARVRTALSAYVKLLRASRAVIARVEKRLAAEGLTVTQFGVLEALLHRGPLTQRELGRKVLTSPGNMTDVVDKMERRGLVHRSRSTTDRRQVHVEMTQAGQHLVRELFPRHADDIAQAMAGLEPQDLARLDALLRKLGMAAAQDPPPHPPL